MEISKVERKNDSDCEAMGENSCRWHWEHWFPGQTVLFQELNNKLQKKIEVLEDIFTDNWDIENGEGNREGV